MGWNHQLVTDHSPVSYSMVLFLAKGWQKAPVPAAFCQPDISCWPGEALPEMLINDPSNANTMHTYIYIYMYTVDIPISHTSVYYIYIYRVSVFLISIYEIHVWHVVFKDWCINQSQIFGLGFWFCNSTIVQEYVLIHNPLTNRPWNTNDASEVSVPFVGWALFRGKITSLPCLEFRQSSDASSRPCRFRLGMVRKRWFSWCLSILMKHIDLNACIYDMHVFRYMFMYRYVRIYIFI